MSKSGESIDFLDAKIIFILNLFLTMFFVCKVHLISILNLKAGQCQKQMRNEKGRGTLPSNYNIDTKKMQKGIIVSDLHV
jgi:hypothetical protein